MITAVTTTDVVVELRPPRIAQLLFAVSLVFAAVMVVVFVREFADGSPFTYVFPVALAGILAFNTATTMSQVRGTTDGTLEVRNRFTTRRLHRSDVDRVIVDRGGFQSAARLELLLTDGAALKLIATEVPPLPGVRRRLERQAEELRSWVANRPAPFLS